MRKIKIAAVSYLNTKPLLYGIFKSPLADKIELQLDIPADCAAKLKHGEVDLGLVPVAIIPEIPGAHIISDYCIGSVGPVRTVAIFSEQAIGQLERIYLDHHSRTSVELTKILLRDHWRLTPELIPAYEGYEHQIGGTTGGLVIGDRTIGLEKRYPYRYDLGSAWTEHTGLPFVFAAWVSSEPLPEEFIREFNEALKTGVTAVPELIYLLPKPSSGFDLKEYFTHYISYALDGDKKKALELFLQRMKKKQKSSILPLSVSR